MFGAQATSRQNAIPSRTESAGRAYTPERLSRCVTVAGHGSSARSAAMRSRGCPMGTPLRRADRADLRGALLCDRPGAAPGDAPATPTCSAELGPLRQVVTEQRKSNGPRNTARWQLAHLRPAHLRVLAALDSAGIRCLAGRCLTSAVETRRALQQGRLPGPGQAHHGGLFPADKIGTVGRVMGWRSGRAGGRAPARWGFPSRSPGPTRARPHNR